MGLTLEQIKENLTPTKVQVLVTCLEVISNNDPIGVELVEHAEMAKNALNFFKLDISELEKKAKRFDEIEEMIAEEMNKPEEESDLLIIGEKIVSHLGYWG